MCHELPVVYAQRQIAFNAKNNEYAVEPYAFGAFHRFQLVKKEYAPVILKRTGHVELIYLNPPYTHIFNILPLSGRPQAYGKDVLASGPHAMTNEFKCKETAFSRNNGYPKFIINSLKAT